MRIGKHIDRYRKLALWCWALPAVMGGAVFVAYLALLGGITGRWFLILMAGELTIVIGVVLTVVGVACLIIDNMKNGLKWSAWRFWRGILLLFSNYILAAVFVLIAVKTWEHAQNPFLVEVSNHCSIADIKTLEFIDPAGNVHPFESVARGELIKHGYRFIGEGRVMYRYLISRTDMKAHAPQQSGVLLGYITSGMDTYITTRMEFHDSCMPKDGAECDKECIVTITGKD